MPKNIKRKSVLIFTLLMLTLNLIASFLPLDIIEIPQVKANPNTNELRFALISDIHFGQAPGHPDYTEEREMLEHVLEHNPDFIIDLGDWLGNNEHSSWNPAQDKFVTYSNLSIFNILGNHDEMAYKDTDYAEDYVLICPDEWRDEATGDPWCYAYLHNNILFIFISTATNSQSNNFIRWRVRRFVEYVLEKYSTQTFMLFQHHWMNDSLTTGASYPAYKTGYWATTQKWAEKLMNDYGSRCLGWFCGHMHFDVDDRNATWKYGTYHFPIGNRGEQYFGLVNITSSGYSYRAFTWEGIEHTLVRMDNTTFSTSFDSSKNDEFCIPIWVQDGTPHGQYMIHTLAQSRKIELVGVRGNETYVTQDMWMENHEGPYNNTNPTLRTWKPANQANNPYWRSLEEYGGDYRHTIHIINATQASPSGLKVLGSWNYKWGYDEYYNVTLRIKANETITNGVYIQESSTSDFLFNCSVITEWQWFHSSSNDECVHQQNIGSIDLYVRENATYYIDFFGARPNDSDNDTTDNPSVTINGNTYNYTGTLNPKSNYTYSSFPFPSTNYDDIAATSISGNKEVMLNIIYVNPTWRITNAFVSKNGDDISTSTTSSDYNNTRIIAYMDASPDNPQFMLMKGEITGFTEPSWAANTLSCNVTGTGNSIFRVDVADQGEPTCVEDEGTRIDFTYNSSNGIITFNVTLGSEHQIDVNFKGDPLQVTLNSPSDGSIETANSQTFQYTPVSYGDDIQNATLWLNLTGSWQAAQTNTTIVQNNTQNNISFNFKTYGSATYIWNIQIFNSTASAFATSNRTLYIKLEPWYDSAGHNATDAGRACLFYSQWLDGDDLSHCVFGTNNTGNWANETYTLEANPDWCNVTKTLNSTVGVRVEYQFWANDTGNRWNTTGLQYLVTSGAGDDPPTYVEASISYNTTTRTYTCKFACQWQDDTGLSGFMFGWNNSGGWSNESWSDPWAGTPTSEWANVTKTLPNNAGVVVGFRWYCNDTANHWGDTGIQTLATTEIWHYFQFSFNDLDDNNVENRITWKLYNGSQQLSYTKGQATLLEGTYTLRTYYLGHQIDQSSVATSTYGNSTFTTSLQMKPHSSVSGGYIAFNNTITSITINSQTPAKLTFTVSGSGSFWIIVRIPKNAICVQRNGVNQTGWVYSTSPAKHIHLNTTTLSTWTLLFQPPPAITVLSPENKTYTTTFVPLTFTVNEATSWISYSLDNGANITITGNTTLALSEGSHNIVVYANDTAGNMGSSSKVYFRVDITPPAITGVSQSPPKENVQPEDEVKVNATVTDYLSGVKQVTLNYTNGNGTWITVDMTNLEGNVWNATIPAFPYCTYLNYTIVAKDNVGNIITINEVLGYQYQYHVIPEFPPFIIMPLFMIATLLAVIAYRRKHSM